MNNSRHFRLQYLTPIYLALVGVLWFGAPSIRAEYFYVATNGAGGDYKSWATAATNIQDAVNVATNTDDTVLVSNGVYTTTTPVINVVDSSPLSTNTSVVCLTNKITLKSVNGPAVTVIDGNYPAITARCVFVSQAAILSGFTIRNGRAESPYCLLWGVRGGGIFIYQRSTNDGPAWGGTVTNCLIYGNYSSENGGGIAIYSATSIVANCTIYSNTCSQGGGMDSSYGRYSTVENCVFYGNKCTGTPASGYNGGGGMFIYKTGMEIRNCLFYSNDSYSYGGGLTVRNTAVGYTIYLENCTVVNNTSTNFGGGLLISNHVAHVRNSIIWGNYAPNYAEILITTNISSLTNCCLSDTNGVPSSQMVGTITNNPLFINAANADYRLGPSSPCINTGMNQNWMTNSYDLDGRRRIMYGIVDRGAYERLNEGTVFIFR